VDGWLADAVGVLPASPCGGKRVLSGPGPARQGRCCVGVAGELSALSQRGCEGVLTQCDAWLLTYYLACLGGWVPTYGVGTGPGPDVKLTDSKWIDRCGMFCFADGGGRLRGPGPVWLVWSGS
jgi:hypothetical protein